MRVARNCGVIDPENIDEYIAMDGYKKPDQGAYRNDAGAGYRRVKKSGLRGRGGAGFPTGTK